MWVCVCVRVQRQEKPHPHIFPYIPHISLVFGSDMFRWWFQIHHTSLPNSWAMWPDKSIKQLSSNASQTIPDDTSDTSDTTWYHTLCRQSDLLERSRVETSRRSQVTVNSRSACRRSDLVGDHMVYYIMVSRRLVKAFTIFHDLSRVFGSLLHIHVTRCYKNLFLKLISLSPSNLHFISLPHPIPPHKAGKPRPATGGLLMRLNAAGASLLTRLRLSHMVTKMCKIIISYNKYS